MENEQNGKKDETNGQKTASQLVSTLVPVLLVAVVMVLAFLFLRRLVHRTYQPRTMNLPSLRQQERSPKLSNGLFNWFGEFMKISDTYVLNHQSIDSYLLLRYLKISATICFVGCLITWPILFPVCATGGGVQVELNLLTYSNISQPNNPRLYAFTFVGWAFYSFVWYMIARETIYYINIRHAYLLSPLYANRMSSRTVLYASVPNDFLDGQKIRRLFGKHMKNYWISTDTKELDKLVKERDQVVAKLEAAENKLIKSANDARLKSLKKGGASHEEEHAETPLTVDGESGSAASKWVATKDRPTHKTKFLIGKKVDTINWCRAELERLIPQVQQEQAKHKAGEAKYVNSIIVEFHTQAEAQAAYQTTTHHHALHMAPRYIGINPEEIIWKNMRILWWERLVRNGATIAAVIALVIFWAIPVAFVGVLSNIDSLIERFPWLGFLNSIPDVIFGVVKGLLPSILLAVLMALLPIILRLLARLGGCMSSAQVELRTQNFYFAFQIIQVFLVATVASAATAVVPAILNDPTSAANLLAVNIPKASNLYIAYFIVQGLSIPAGAVLQIVGLILFRVLGKILDKTPRKQYNRWVKLSGLGWGTLFPVYSLLSAISIIYACIAPLMMGFAAIALYLMYLAYRYNVLFVFHTTVDTQGRVYARALQHTTVGIYIALICNIGLLAIAQAPGPTILTAVYLIFSILFHVSFRSAVSPLLNTLPKSLEVEEEHLLSLEAGGSTSDGVTEKNGHGNGVNGKGALAIPAPHKKPNFFSKWLHPEIYTDYATLRRMVPRDFAEIVYDPETERNAYYNPAVTSDAGMIWVPRDTMGVSRQEVAHTSKVMPISDEAATFNDKGKVQYDTEARPPIWEEKIYY